MRELTLAEVRKVGRIPSGYRTDRTWVLERRVAGPQLTWTLREESLSVVKVKTYDSGRVDQWLSTYADAGPVSDLRFLGAFLSDRCEGLLTWRPVTWNDTVWLVDVRVRELERGNGLGSAMVERLKQLTRGQARGILVETQTGNFPAVRFYRKHGFAVAGFNDHLYTNHDRDDDEIALYLFWEAD